MKHLILPLLFLCSFTVFSQDDSLNCSQYTNGYFSYLGKLKDYYIYREGDRQIEYSIKTKEYVMGSIEWTGPCTYIYTYLSSNNKEFELFLGRKLEIQIIDTDKDGYKFEAHLTGVEEVFEGDIFVAMDLSKKEKKKLLKAFKKYK